jgi:hypothetical protein
MSKLTRVLELPVFPATECGLGQELLAQSFQGHRISPAGAAPVQSVRGNAQEHLARERIVPGMQDGKLASQLEDVSVAGESVEQDTASGHRVLRGRPLPGRHTPDSRAKSLRRLRGDRQAADQDRQLSTSAYSARTLLLGSRMLAGDQ